MSNKELPIGYWLKKTDLLLTEGINKIQAEYGLTRAEWQLLNLIADNENVVKKRLFEQLQPFANKNKLIKTLSKFTENNVIEEQMTTYRLTIIGQQLRDKCLKKQVEFRKKAMLGITEEQYQVTVKTLTQIVTNLSPQKEQ